MQRALEECVVEGVATTIPFHLRVMEDPVFQRGGVHTGYVAELAERTAAAAATSPEISPAVPEAPAPGAPAAGPGLETAAGSS